jgi:hypothetical protein
MKAICTIIKNEQRFLREWADYHLGVGFDRIYLFEDIGSESHAGLIPDERVVLRRFGDCNIPAISGFRQNDLYAWFMDMHRDSELSWCAFIDADEFIVLNDGATLNALADRYEPYSGVVLYWKVYNANGHIIRPNLPVMKAYTQEVSRWRTGWNFKTFANLRRAGEISNIHRITKDAVNLEYRPVKMLGPSVYGMAHINHYYTKSWEDFVEQLKTGTLCFNNRICDDFFDLNPDMWNLRKKLILSIDCKKVKAADCLSRRLEIYTVDNNRARIGLLNRKI